MKVLIADEHALFRDGLGLLIEQLLIWETIVGDDTAGFKFCPGAENS